MTKRFAAAAGLVLLSIPPAPAVAQDGNPTWRVRVGAGAQIRPEFLGSDEREVAPAFDLSVASGNEPFGFGTPDQSFGISLIKSDAFSAGPVVEIAGGRKDSEAGVPLGKVPTTVEAGAFAQYWVSDSLRVRGELRKGIGGHEGVVGSVGADQVWRDADKYLFSIGPRVLFSNARYQREWFGITPEAALATGLPAYRPGGGVHALGAVGTGHMQLSGPWGLFGFARYERLVGDAGKSPIVRELGSRNQLSAGVGINYTFGIRL